MVSTVHFIVCTDNIIPLLISHLTTIPIVSFSASIWLTCHAVECTVKITPPSSFTTTKLTFSRKQLVKTQAIKVDKDHNFVKIDSGPPMHRYTKDARKKQKRKKNNGGPDDDGNYDSYTMVLRPPIENNDPEDETAQFEVALSALDAFTYDEEGTDNRVLPMRQFNIGQTKRRTRTMTSKVDSYIQQRRHQLIIKENASLSWQGVLAVVFGLFFLLITFLVGSFFDELTTPTGGPGTRRKTTAPKKKTRKTVPGKYH
jgi:hypothetical protein